MKMNTGRENAHVHPNVRSKMINNERKKLTHHEILDRIAEQTASVII